MQAPRFCLGAVLVIALLAGFRTRSDEPAKEVKADFVLKVEGKLTADDPKDAVRKDSYCKVHTVKLEKDVVYRIDLISTQFDAYLRLEDAAYGAAIRQEIHARAGRDVSIGAVYTTLDRLETKGLVRSSIGAPTAQRGGRRRKLYAIQPAGLAALRQAHRAIAAMAEGLEARLEAK